MQQEEQNNADMRDARKRNTTATTTTITLTTSRTEEYMFLPFYTGWGQTRIMTDYNSFTCFDYCQKLLPF